MNTLTIKDLSFTEELSVEAARKISGGFITFAAIAATLLVVGANEAGVFDSISVSDLVHK